MSTREVDMSENSISGDDFVDVGGGDVNLSRMPAFTSADEQTDADSALDASALPSQEGEPVQQEVAGDSAVDGTEGTV